MKRLCYSLPGLSYKRGKGVPRLLFLFLHLPAFVLLSSFAYAQTESPKSDPSYSYHLKEESPVDFFRQLLKMSPEERSQALEGKTPSDKNYIAQRLADYETMSAEERELRLKLLELRYYLVPLMRMNADERQAHWHKIPAEQQPLIEQRLDLWDELPREAQQQVLQHRWFLQYFVRLEETPPTPGHTVLLQSVPAEQRKALKARLDQWQTLPREERQRMCQHFQQFFELSTKEKQKILNVLSEQERQRMQTTLNLYAKLPRQQRETLLNAFRKLASMNDTEIARFLQGAERWKAMSPEEQDAWRRMVSNLPPLPPGFGQTKSPPVPPSLESKEHPPTPESFQ